VKSRRTDLVELMDDPHVDAAQLAVSLRFIRRVNKYLGGTRAILSHLKPWSRRWSGPVSIVDIATGSADIPLAITRWAARHNKPVHITAIDIHQTTLAHAADFLRANHAQNITLLRTSAFDLPFADRSVDYATTSMFLHHLADDQALAVIREMLRISRRGIIINDLLRSPQAYVGICLATLLADHIDKHDARVSVKKAWSRPEVKRWPAQLNAPWLRYHYHFPARFTLAGERPEMV